jgi:hypothetical protein
MCSYLDLWGEAVALTGAAGDGRICVSAGVAAALTLTGNHTALGVYSLLVHRVASGEPVTLDALAAVVGASAEGRERLRMVVAFLFAEGLIPALVAVEAGVVAGDVIPQ